MAHKVTERVEQILSSSWWALAECSLILRIVDATGESYSYTQALTKQALKELRKTGKVVREGHLYYRRYK